MNEAEEIETFLGIGKYDWYVTKSWNRLHYAEIPEDAQKWIPEEWAICESVRLVCGRTAQWLGIPGMLTRMGAPRCKDCCRILGYPQGKGSPKNDDACRRILGLEVQQ